ncbi:unnamed protein product [Vitrella brassicaformis CCMP3155]|uniref:Uncharacterized protein n=1 Tax=Vitrella brassicaformis (strain CCMP3155) TaxID=1169540 RepID=A0A0G4FSE8_VITBC|nr:unnamed protein product [Vitrella brassicaformis CCMP3155]|eukprot:CEM17626.1 unnamed protein product [Vitrella brassicaformis CCMP3155]
MRQPAERIVCRSLDEKRFQRFPRVTSAVHRQARRQLCTWKTLGFCAYGVSCLSKADHIQDTLEPRATTRGSPTHSDCTEVTSNKHASRAFGG